MQSFTIYLFVILHMIYLQTWCNQLVTLCEFDHGLVIWDKFYKILKDACNPRLKSLVFGRWSDMFTNSQLMAVVIKCYLLKFDLLPYEILPLTDGLLTVLQCDFSWDERQTVFIILDKSVSELMVGFSSFWRVIQTEVLKTGLFGMKDFEGNNWWTRLPPWFFAQMHDDDASIWTRCDDTEGHFKKPLHPSTLRRSHSGG